MLSIVELMRQLSDSRVATGDLLLRELDDLGFERLQPKIPSRKDVVKFSAPSIYRKGDVAVLVTQGVGQEAGRKYAMLSLTITDKSAALAQTVADVSQWLGAEPEYPARGAQFAVLENGTERTPITLAEAAAWRERPLGSLAHMTVDDMGSGVSIMRILTKVV
jgi:hypothetical protein